MNAAIRLVDVGKRYVKYEDVPLLLTRALRLRAGHKRSDLWAVRHLDLAVEHGETVGMVGRNGSGKTTTMRMLAGVTEPTEGSVSVRGRVAPLIAVGVGFHPELTGRENVYVNAAVLGLARREVDSLFDQIVAFAELEKFIDTPVKFYSSGMFVRLGFSVAVASRPDVLLVDEVLAVGDLAFQTKCFDRMAEIKREGTSVVIVSHNMNAIRLLASRVLVVREGVPVFLGPTEDAISVYHRILAPASDGEATAGPLELNGLEMLGGDGKPTAYVKAGEEVTFRAAVRFLEPVSQPVFAIRLFTEQNQLAYLETTRDIGTRDFHAGEEVQCEIKMQAALGTGSYSALFSVGWGPLRDTEMVATRTSTAPVHFFVAGRPNVKGVADLRARFSV